MSLRKSPTLKSPLAGFSSAKMPEDAVGPWSARGNALRISSDGPAVKNTSRVATGTAPEGAILGAEGIRKVLAVPRSA